MTEWADELEAVRHERDVLKAEAERLRGLLKRASKVMCGLSSNAYGPLLEYVSPKFRAEFEALADAINAEIYPEARAAREGEVERLREFAKWALDLGMWLGGYRRKATDINWAQVATDLEDRARAALEQEGE